jgi:membrane-anchored protein YejM (alkaline phosphatase superfamily)
MVSEIKKGIDSNWAFEYSRDQAEVLFPELLKAAPDYDKELVVLNKIADTGMLWNYLADYQYNDLIDVNNPEDMKYMAALYDQTINILDNNKIPLLTNLINDPEFNDNTILVIFGDHGEEFMEHGHLYHETIYNSNIRVPLIMSIPGIYGEKIKENVQLVDVFPTLMKALGIKTDIPFDGKSLLGRIFGVDKSREVIVADGYQLKSKALIYDQWKLLLVQQEGGYMPYELYNIVDDPSESKNILYSNITVQNNILRLYSETVEK